MIVKTLLIDRLHNTAAGGVQVPVPAQHERQRGPASVPGIARTFTPLYRADTDCAAVAQCLGCNSMI